MSKELQHPTKGLINIQNIIDNECFKWYLVRYLHPTDHNPRKMRKFDKLCGDKLDFESIRVPFKVRDKVKEIILLAVVLLVMKIRNKMV